jgi:ABC-type dipeptide/oligopeptide/nickel transport system permease component
VVDTRAALARAGNTLVSAIFMIVFVLAFAFASGENIFAFHAFYGGTSVFVEVAQRLPFTAELVVASFIVAVALGFVLGGLPRRVPGPVRRALLAVAVGLRAIPFFWLAVAAPLPVFLVMQDPHAFGLASLDHFDIRDRLAHLWGPASVLAVCQIPALASFFSAPANASSAKPLLGSLYAVFARGLPEVIGAALITEVAFGWPGLARIVITGEMGSAVIGYAGSLLVVGVVALIVRAFASADD